MTQNQSKYPVLRMDNAPKNLNPRGLTNEQQKDWDIIYNTGGESQYIICINLPYYDHNGRQKIIVGAIYNIVRQMLPRRLPPLPPPPSNLAYAIRDIPGKGKGVLATRDIALGEIVIIERPILIYALTMTTEDNSIFERYTKDSMHPYDWKAYHELLNVKDSHVSEFTAIAGTNGFCIDLVEECETYAAVFLQLSRLNHSCGPNLTRSWNPHLYTLSAQAVRPIKAGQELTLSYEDLLDSHTDRRFDLERKYKFICKCGYCTKTSPTSDFDRSVKKEDVLQSVFEDEYGVLIKPGLPLSLGRQRTKIFVSNLVRSLVLVVTEGIECVAARPHYVYLMKAWGLLGDKKHFKEWGFKAILLSVTYTELEGQEACLEVERWIDWVKDPEQKFPDWGKFR